MNPRGEVADRHLFAQSQQASALHPILRESQGDAAGWPGAAGGVPSVGEIDYASLAKRSCRVQISGVEVESEILDILAGKVGGGNGAYDLVNSKKVVRGIEIKREIGNAGSSDSAGARQTDRNSETSAEAVASPS